MVLAFSLDFTIRDQKGKESSSSIKIPATLSIAQYVEFGTDALQIIVNNTSGQVVNAGISAKLDLTAGSLNTVVSTLADVAEKAFFSFRSTVGGLFARFKIPTMSEASMVVAGTDQLDPTDTALAAFIAAVEDGITLTDTTVVQPTDKYGNDLEALNLGREIFQRHNR